MIIQLTIATILFLSVRSWIRRRRAAKDMARRIVPVPLEITVRYAQDLALAQERNRAIMEKVYAARDAADEARCVAHRAEIKRNQLQWEANERRLYG